MMREEDRNIALVRRWYREVWCEGSVATALELTSPDVVAHLEDEGDTDREGFLSFHAEMLRGISGFHVEVLEATASGDKVVVHWHISGRHTGTLYGVPASGREVDEWGMTKFKVADGVFVEGWDSWNIHAFLEKLAAPDPAQLAEKHGLTPRQVEVALLLSDKASAKQIAARLGISVNTARRHCQDVLQRLGVHNRAEVGPVLFPEARAGGD